MSGSIGPRKVKSFRPLKAFEALLVFGGRERRQAVVGGPERRIEVGGRQHSHPGALVGMKPAAFCEWMLELLGATRGDELDDLFPGSGAVARTWALFHVVRGSARPVAATWCRRHATCITTVRRVASNSEWA
jgi:hypothetical protein